MIKLLKKDVSTVTESEYHFFVSRLPSSLRGHIEKKKLFSDRVLSAVGYSLLLGEVSGEIAFKENGKPYFKDVPLYFSISHSGNTVICAISDREIGADVEKVREIPRGVAMRFFTERERQCDFFEIWTKKEAYGKCIGDMAKAFATDVCDLSFYTERDKEYAIAVYEK
ncbi:MAG: 4'-phosphopantetheinyl transferase superfamily protein [Clostridia bacterium]|nr:4'-phosphopantetheinyl transferase superfamily protein [Clostridia bacterium]